MSTLCYLPLSRQQYFNALFAHNLRIEAPHEPKAHLQTTLQAVLGELRIALFATIPSTYLDEGLADILVVFREEDLPTKRIWIDYSLCRSAWFTAFANHGVPDQSALQTVREQLTRPCESVDRACMVPVVSLLQSKEIWVRSTDDLHVLSEAHKKVALPKQREKMMKTGIRYAPPERLRQEIGAHSRTHMSLPSESKNILPKPTTLGT